MFISRCVAFSFIIAMVGATTTDDGGAGMKVGGINASLDSNMKIPKPTIGASQPASHADQVPPVPSLSTATRSTEGPEQPASKEGPTEISIFKAHTWKNESVDLSRARSCISGGLLLPLVAPDAEKSALHPFELLLSETQPPNAKFDYLFSFEVCAIGDNSANEIGCSGSGYPYPRLFPYLRVEVGMFLTDSQRKYEMVTESLVDGIEGYQFAPHPDSGHFKLAGAWEWCLPVSSCALYDGLRKFKVSSINDVKIRFSGKLFGEASSAASVRFVVREVTFTSRVVYGKVAVNESGNKDPSVKLIGRDAKKFRKSEDSIYWYGDDRGTLPQCWRDVSDKLPTRIENVSTFFSRGSSFCESEQGCEIRAEWENCKRSCPALQSAIALGQNGATTLPE